MIYLDSAATTLQKPPAVPRACARAMTTMASPGRGGHLPARRAAETVFALRELGAELFGVGDAERVVLTHSATHGLNLAIRTLVRPGMRVVISGFEHNAVTRTLAAIPGVRVAVARGALFDRGAVVRDFESELGAERTGAVICTHVSNVFGFILPLEEIAALCRRCGVPLIVDAAQSAGVLPLSVEELGAEFAAMPGHKGLYGPQGTGLLLCGGCLPEPLLFGGTGSESRNQQMPDFLPDRLEAGTHNVCGAAGLLEGLRFVRRVGAERISEHENRLCRCFADDLSRLPGVTVYRGREDTQSGVCSFEVEGLDCEEVGERLAERGIAVRAGLHCAPLAHETAGTLERGTVRASFSAFNTEGEVCRAVEQVWRIAKGR